MRINKYIALCGVASRRKADDLIASGRVKINGKVVKEMGVNVSKEDKVEVSGQPISLEERKVYLIINKPTKYLSTVTDDRKRATVIDLIKDKYPERLYPVGRLDYETEGLLILTNDGNLTNKLTHPKHEVKKTYVVGFKGRLQNHQVAALEKGVVVDEYRTQPCKISDLRVYMGSTKCKITIQEGKNRQIRKMFATQGYEVKELRRISIGAIELGDLKVGEYREVTKEELKYLKTLG